MNNKKIIKDNFNKFADQLYANYNKIKVIDDYDFYNSNPYTIYYLGKNESFEKFADLWEANKKECRELDLCYDDILDCFNAKANDKKIDFLELACVNINTDSQYELEI